MPGSFAPAGEEFRLSDEGESLRSHGELERKDVAASGGYIEGENERFRGELGGRFGDGLIEAEPPPGRDSGCFEKHDAAILSLLPPLLPAACAVAGQCFGNTRVVSVQIFYDAGVIAQNGSMAPAEGRPAAQNSVLHRRPAPP